MTRLRNRAGGNSSWWELEPNELMDFYDLMHDPAAFAQAIMDGRRND